MPIALLVADDYALVREGLRCMFAGTDVEVVAEAATPAEARRAAADPAVDVMLLDLGWRQGQARSLDGFDLLAEIRGSRARLAILMYSLYDRADYVERCRRLGADGYLVKGVDDRRLPAAVRAAYAVRRMRPGRGFAKAASLRTRPRL